MLATIDQYAERFKGNRHLYPLAFALDLIEGAEVDCSTFQHLRGPASVGDAVAAATIVFDLHPFEAGFIRGVLDGGRKWVTTDELAAYEQEARSAAAVGSIGA